MKSGDLLFSSVQFLFSVFLVLVGVAAICVGAVPSVYQHCLVLFAKGSSFILALGVLLSVFGLLLLILFYRMNRGQYYDVQLSSCQARVESSLIQESALRYFASLDLPYPIDCQVIGLKKGKVALSLLLPSLSHKERKELLSQLERELPFLFKEQLGYNQPLELSFLIRKVSYPRAKRAFEKRKEKRSWDHSCKEEGDSIAPVENY